MNAPRHVSTPSSRRKINLATAMLSKTEHKPCSRCASALRALSPLLHCISMPSWVKGYILDLSHVVTIFSQTVEIVGIIFVIGHLGVVQPVLHPATHRIASWSTYPRTSQPPPQPVQSTVCRFSFLSTSTSGQILSCYILYRSALPLAGPSVYTRPCHCICVLAQVLMGSTAAYRRTDPKGHVGRLNYPVLVGGGHGIVISVY